MFLGNSAPQLRFLLHCDLFTPSTMLCEDPLGWDAMGLTLYRNEKYHGLTAEFTEDQLGFVKLGKVVLSQAYAARGIEAEVELEIQLLDPNAFAWETYRRLRVDFTDARETATVFYAGIEQTGFTQRFLNREEVPINLLANDSVSGYALPAPAPTTVSLHSRALVRQYTAQVKQFPLESPANFVSDGTSRFQTVYFGAGEPTQDDFTKEEVQVGQLANGVFTVPTGGPAALPIYVAKGRGEHVFDFAFYTELTVQQMPPVSFPLEPIYFRKVEATYCYRAGNRAPVIFAQFSSTVNKTDFVRAVDLVHRDVVHLEIGEEVYLYASVHVHDINNEGNFGGYSFPIRNQVKVGSRFHLQGLTQTEPTACPGLLVYEALQRVAQATTDQTDCFRSAFFGRPDTAVAYPADGPGSLLLVTGGFQARGFPLEKKGLFATWSELLDALIACYNVGVGIEQLPDGREVIRVEDMVYFYADDVVLDLPEPVTLETSVLPDAHYNAVEVGYQKWAPQQKNGLDEYNARHTYALPLTQVKNKYAQLSPYSAAGHYIESVRRNRYDATATEDTSTDNENFLVCLLRTPGGYETERNQRATVLEGVLSPETVYNLRLSPRRMLLRHVPAVAAGLVQRGDKRVMLSFGEGNTQVRSQLMGEALPVEESGELYVSGVGASVGIPTLADPLWYPQAYSFTAPCTAAQMQRLASNPRGRVRFRDEAGQVCEGWVREVKHELNKRTATFTLLRCRQLSSGYGQ